MSNQKAIDYMQIRGGSSKGVYFHADDLPSDTKERDKILLKIMDGAHELQVDGLGGGNPLLSKVGIIKKSNRDDCDIDYLFCQILVGKNKVDSTPNCGNILAGVGAFALETGLLTTDKNEITIRVFMENSGKICALSMQCKDGFPLYEGDTHIDGVCGTSAPILCNYHDIAGSICGALLPTGNAQDMYDGVAVTCIDNGMPVLALDAKDVGISGYETPDELNNNDALKAKIESIRLQAGKDMGLGDVSEKAIPKICMISDAKNGGTFNTRTFIPFHCHQSIGVLGAVSAASAVLLKNSAVHKFLKSPAGKENIIKVEHPSGQFQINLSLDEAGNIVQAGLVRTARLLSKGVAYV